MWNFFIYLTLLTLQVRDSIGDCNKTVEASTADEYTLFNFTDTDGVDGWTEQSDTVRTVGLSKAAFVIHNNTAYRRAVFFSLLNPQSNGAAFAGVRYLGRFNVSGYSNLEIYFRGQGQYQGFKIVLRHKCQNDEPYYTYEQFFNATEEFATVSLSFANFEPYFRGRVVNTTDTLDLSQISSVGIQAYGGVYLDVQQQGVASLEVDWIKVTV